MSHVGNTVNAGFVGTQTPDRLLYDHLHNERVNAEQRLSELRAEVERCERIVNAASAALDQMPELAQPVQIKPQDYASAKAHQAGVSYS